MSESRESMIERVARAICQEENRDPDRRMPTSINPPDGRPLWTSYEWQARAAIEAMREPTDEMLVAGRVGEGGRTQAEDVWADMIAAALGEDHP